MIVYVRVVMELSMGMGIMEKSYVSADKPNGLPKRMRQTNIPGALGTNGVRIAKNGTLKKTLIVGIVPNVYPPAVKKQLFPRTLQGESVVV